MKYPLTKKIEFTEEFFGVKIDDPYRWLEDDKSEETISWLKQQQELTESVLNEYLERKDILNRLLDLNDFKKETCPLKRGDWYYFFKNDGLQNQWVSYRKRTLDGESEVFLDPNTLSEDGTTRASIVGRSKDNKYFTYMISKAGSDAGEFWIMDTETKTFLADKLFNMKHSGAAWYKNGYYYSKYDAEEDNQKQDKNQRIFYHKLGDNTENDLMVFEEPEFPLRYNHASVSDDERYLFIYSSEGTSGNRILFKALDDEKAEFKCLFAGFEFNAGIYNGYERDSFYLFTDKGAKNYHLYKINLLQPAEENWVKIIPERDYLLDSINIVGNKLITIFIKDVQSKIEVLDLDGNFLYDITMPYQGCAQFFNAQKEDKEGFFYFSSYVRPDEIFHYDVPKNELSFYYTDPVKADFSKIVSEQIFFPSKDGTKVPMTLVYQKGLTLDGNNPVYLYGYGGFNNALLPYFKGDLIPFLEKGGIYVVVNLRGGGEYGEDWHQQGMLDKKQNVFDDFIAAAEYMIKENYTNPAKIAIAGGSNGGLLVGACMLQRPDLFKAAIPMMGVLDMLRYHKFTCGWGWMVEYGNPDEEEHFHNILKYSPVHNVKEGVQYPATMVVTADHDDRVIPGHSFKFAATLQEKANQDLPLLIYTQFKSSHGSSSLTKHLEISADVWTFVFKYLEM